MPIYKAVATGNGNNELQRNNTFKFKITLDRHNAIQNLNYYDLPDPRHFLLPSTFKEKSTLVDFRENFLHFLVF